MYRTTARLIGILFLVCTGATLLSFPFAGAYLGESGFLPGLADKQTMIITGALLEFVWGITCVGIAMAFYTLLRKFDRFMALSAIGLRAFESAFVLIGVASLLTLLSLSKELAGADTATAVSIEATGSLMIALRYWSQTVISALAFALGALMYYIVLYRSKVIPRWLSGWGIIGAVLAVIATVITAYAGGDGSETLDTILNAPIGINELVLAVWLIAKGFDPEAIDSLKTKGKGV